MDKYPKVYSPYTRFTDGPKRNKLDWKSWTSPEIEVLADLPWDWTEKVDGTNIRVGWDGHTVAFGGRTDNAQIPATLFKRLQLLFPEELFEQVFKDKEVTLYGEGYGPKIQAVGAQYRDDQDFALFDVKIGRTWLRPEDVWQVAADMGIAMVPAFAQVTLYDAIEAVSEGLPSRYCNFKNPDQQFFAEGMVGRAPHGLLDRNGNRIMVKVKHVDFYES